MLDYSPKKYHIMSEKFNKVILACKIVILILFVIWIILTVITTISRKKKYKNKDKIEKIYKIFNDIAFYSVILLILVSSILIIFIFNKSHLFIFKYYFPKIFKKIKMDINVDYSIVPRYYVSLIWWVMIWVLVISILAIISKIKNDQRYILFAF